MDGGSVHEGLLVMKEEAAISDADDIVVEDPCVDGSRVLLCEDGAGRVECAEPCHALARKSGLARCKPARRRTAAVVDAVDKQVEPRGAMLGREPRVVGRPLVAQRRVVGQRPMDGEVVRVGEEATERIQGLVGLDGPVGLGDQIGHHKVEAAVEAVGRGMTVPALAVHMEEADM